MNRIYQVIWSSVKDCYVVVSENAGRHGKKKAVHLAPSTTKRTMLAMSLGAAVLFGSAASASAATGNKVIGGSQDAVTDAKGNTDQAVATGDYSTISGGYLNHAEGKAIIPASAVVQITRPLEKIPASAAVGRTRLLAREPALPAVYRIRLAANFPRSVVAAAIRPLAGAQSLSAALAMWRARWP